MRFEVLLIGGMLGAQTVQFTALERKQLARLSPLPEVPEDTTNGVANVPLAAELGHFLFFDPALSATGEISCSSCHNPQQGFADGRPLAEGLAPLARHSPSLWNVAYQRWFFWDGRADSLWSQALQPLEHPAEMGGSRLGIARQIATREELRSRYERLFGSLPAILDWSVLPAAARPVTGQPEDPLQRSWDQLSREQQAAIQQIFVRTGKALAAYERQLISRESAFDQFCEGLQDDNPDKLAALSDSAQRGLRLFLGRGQCLLCHHGPNLSDGEFHSIRVPPLGGGAAQDAGRYEGVKKLLDSDFHAAGIYSDDRNSRAAQRLEFLVANPEQWGTFKTPSLRNVAQTAPYMHQGQFASLQEVLRFYSTLEGALPPDHHQQDEVVLQPLRLSEQEIQDLVAFLESLTDEKIAESWKLPPRSGRSKTAEPPSRR
jgi:cytochrome c peroxidase